MFCVCWDDEDFHYNGSIDIKAAVLCILYSFKAGIVDVTVFQLNGKYLRSIIIESITNCCGANRLNHLIKFVRPIPSPLRLCKTFL